MKKWKIDRIISVATLVASLIAIVLVLKKPQPVARPQAPAAAAANAQSFQAKVQQLEQPKQAGQAAAEVHLSSDEVGAALAQAAAGLPQSEVPAPADQASPGLPSTAPSSPDHAVGSSGLRKRIRHIRSHGIQSRRSERAGVAGEGCPGEEAG